MAFRSSIKFIIIEKRHTHSKEQFLFKGGQVNELQQKALQYAMGKGIYSLPYHLQ